MTFAATVREHLRSFSQLQWLAEAEIEARQLRPLGALLDWAWQQSPLQRERLAQAGYRPGATLDPALWSAIPTLDRATLQARGEELCSAQVPETHGDCDEVATSGSLGQVVRVKRTVLALSYWAAVTVREHEWHARDPHGTLAAIRWFPDGLSDYPGTHAQSWGGAMGLLHETGPAHGLSITASAQQQADWLGQVQPDALVVFPSLVADLVRACRERGVVLENLRHVRTIAEQLDPTVRDLCRREWNAAVEDVYSAQETGYLALQCPTNEHYHVQSESVRLEVLDDDGRPCAPGEIGRVVVTPLHNWAMPLVRYEIGDWAEVGPSCSCGRGLPVLRRILGRSRNILTLPDGRRIWPRLSQIYYHEILPIARFQLIQEDLTHLRMKLVSERPGSASEEARLRELLLSRLMAPFSIEFEYVSDIPRGPGGKYEDFRSQIDGDSARVRGGSERP